MDGEGDYIAMKKIAVITSTRAEYGLLYPLIAQMRADPAFDVQLLVSGTHLLEQFGNTVDYIRADGVPIAETIPILAEDFAGDEAQAADAVAKAVHLSTGIFLRERYDAIVVLGDRYELLGFCTAAVLCRIPIVHIHGGEITEGAIDDKIRHAVTKLASVHFPSVQEYADRIIQMGEDPKRVYPVGALGIDNIMRADYLAKEELLRELGISTDLPLAAVTYHPVTSLSPSEGITEIRQVLEALLETGVYSIITMPNSDVGGMELYREILQYVGNYGDRMTLQKSLGQVRYLSLLRCADIMVGNSSSGILESASFALPTVNIGDRQKGRMAPANVISCSCRTDEICRAIRSGLSQQFRESLRGYRNPYGDGKTAKRIVSVLKEIDWADLALIQKKFYDIR